MDLTEQHVRVIREWAAKEPVVKEVRLFGSRAKGGAPPHSDVDLAITIGGPSSGVIRGHYYALGQKWQDELTKMVGLKVNVNHYNELEDETVRRACEESSRLLFRREGD